MHKPRPPAAFLLFGTPGDRLYIVGLVVAIGLVTLAIIGVPYALILWWLGFAIRRQHA